MSAGTTITLPPGMAPVAPLMRMLAKFDRPKIEAFVEVSIALLDLTDPDPDIEPDGDEEDSDGDEKGDPAWIEWTTMRGSQKGGPNIVPGHEDDEEDDPAGQCDEDGINTQLVVHQQGYGPGCEISDSDQGHDGFEPEEERDLHLDYETDQSAGPLSPRLADDAALRKPHLDRIRMDLRVEELRYPDYNGRTHRIPID